MKKALVKLLLILTISHLGSAKMQIVTSINVLSDWLKIIGEDKIEVTTLVTGLETPHTYSPRPSDALAIKKATAFIGIGLSLESWLLPLVKSSGRNNLPVFYLSESLKLIEEEENESLSHSHHTNPHVWLSLNNAKAMVIKLSEILSALDADNAGFYVKNSQNYLLLLQELEAKYKPQFSILEDKRLVSFPASYPYLFKEMGLEEVARGEEIHGQEPSAKKMVSLAALIKKMQIKVIIAEKQFSSVLPSTLAKETNTELVYLSPLLLTKQNYIKLMESNYENLLKGFAR